MNNKLQASLLLLMLASVLFQLNAQTISPFNKQMVSANAADYSFIVSGHFHGESTNRSTFPAATILANIDTLNALKPAFIFSLGDLFLDVDSLNISHYNRSLFQKLNPPLFNVVGNHDIANGNVYEKMFGESHFSFMIGTELFIGLNTEVNDGSIKGEQLLFFKKAIEQVLPQKIKNVFVFSHRPVWAERIERYKQLFNDNTRTKFGTNNFKEDIEPLLVSIAKNTNVFWMSGSLGSAPASFFYDKDPNTGIVYMQTAVRNLLRDAILQVKVKNGEVELKAVSLTGQALNPVEFYNIDFWKRTIPSEQRFNYRLLPYLTYLTIVNPMFWRGIVVAILVMGLFGFFVFRKWKRKK